MKNRVILGESLWSGASIVAVKRAPYPRAGCFLGAIPDVQLGFKIVGVRCDSALVGEGRLGCRFCGRRLVPKNPCRYGEVCFCEKLRFRNGQNVFVVSATTIGGRLSEKGYFSVICRCPNRARPRAWFVWGRNFLRAVATLFPGFLSNKG